MEPLAQLVPLMFLSVIAMWKPHVLLFLIVAGMALMVGLYWFDAYTTDVGLTISLMLIGYSFVALAFGFKVLMWEGEEE